MRIRRPDLHLLEEYVAGTLAPDNAGAVRRWLILAADEAVLDIVDVLHANVARRRQRMAYWATRGVRAALLHRAWRARRAIAHALRLEGPLRGPLPVALGAARMPTAGASGDMLLEVLAGQQVEILVEVGVPTWFGVYAVASDGALRLLLAPPNRHESGARIEAGGPVLDAGDEPIDIFVVFDEHGALAEPPPGADGTWLADLLERAAESVSVLHATLAVAPPSPVRGKQS